MRSYRLNQARSAFSAVFDRALAGEPQRISRYGKEAIVIVAEADYVAAPRKYASLGALLADYAQKGAFADIDFDSGKIKQSRPLGPDFFDWKQEEAQG